jgi:RHS repeat-associated protein
MQFTGKECDVETILDYFGARYYGSVMGRFTSPDHLLASGQSASPQSWNRYSYMERVGDDVGMIIHDLCIA